MLSSSLDAMLKLFKTKSSQKLFRADCITLYITEQWSIQDRWNSRKPTTSWVGKTFLKYFHSNLALDTQ